MKTLQLEQTAVMGQAEKPSVVASRMRLVFSTLEVSSLQIITINVWKSLPSGSSLISAFSMFKDQYKINLWWNMDLQLIPFPEFLAC